MSFKEPTDALRDLINELERDPALDKPDRLRVRCESLHRLDAWLVDEPSGLLDALSKTVVDHELGRRARLLYSRLEGANLELCNAIRRDIQTGAGPASLLRLVQGQSGDQSGIRPTGEGYDYLDELIGGVFQFEEPDDTGVELTVEMVRYQPTPARHIFDMIARTGLTERDVLIDLGSGLGHVALLVSICSGARSTGIELENSYVECARRSASALNVKNVTFIHQDARAADLSTGTLFFLYTPFFGTILREVLDSLKQQASHRPIRIGAFGPCARMIAKERWLSTPDVVEVDRVAVFSSRA